MSKREKRLLIGSLNPVPTDFLKLSERKEQAFYLRAMRGSQVREQEECCQGHPGQEDKVSGFFLPSCLTPAPTNQATHRRPVRTSAPLSFYLWVGGLSFSSAFPLLCLTWEEMFFLR